MKRWDVKNSKKTENKEIDVFLSETIKVCRAHGFSIAHEDGHGGFIIEKAKEFNFNWLLNAADDTQS